MRHAKARNATPAPAMICGQLSKREAAKQIGAGQRHVHGTVHGIKDPLAKLTEQSLVTKNLPSYPWETIAGTHERTLIGSAERTGLSRSMVSDCELHQKRGLREKAETVLEELSSNALYHAYRTPEGLEKYRRREKVVLPPSEVIHVRYAANAQGIYLCVKDLAGTFHFEDIADALRRCYVSKAQIQSKDSGAGLGLYMVFDSVTHLKIHTQLGKTTTVSCWIADQGNDNPEYFSFNFFETE